MYVRYSLVKKVDCTDVFTASNREKVHITVHYTVQVKQRKATYIMLAINTTT